MDDDKKQARKARRQARVINKGARCGGLFFVTYIGAAVYFVQHSHGFGGFVLALLKAAVWPAFVVHKALELLHI